MKVSIRKIEERDLRKKVDWINDSRNNQYLHYDLPLNYEKTIEWYYRIKDSNLRYDAIIELDGEAVGLIGLLNIDLKNGKAEYYVTLGEQSCKGKGVAKRATEILFEYAFTILRLKKVYLYTEVNNCAAQKLFERVGFTREGLLKDDLFHNGMSVSRYAYGITRDDYFSKVGTTPVQCLGDFHGNWLYIKRDDLIPYSFGGNKARKARQFFKEIDKGDYDCVVTYGSGHSNHCRVVANMTAQRKMKCIIVSPEEESSETYNSILIDAFGAKTVVAPVEQVSDTIDELLAELKEEGHNPYFIPGGGHGNIGTAAYVEAYDEIDYYERAKHVAFDLIVHASGTGTTQAGLVCGQLMSRSDKQIVGISIARKNPHGRNVVVDSVRSYLDSVCENDISEQQIQSAVQFVDDYVGDGYADSSGKVLNFINGFMRDYGIPLDSTYTGKALCALENYIASRKLQGANILFIHTGGTPLFFDDLETE